MANILENHLSFFNDYFVKNFYSSIRTALQIIQKVKNY